MHDLLLLVSALLSGCSLSAHPSDLLSSAGTAAGWLGITAWEAGALSMGLKLLCHRRQLHDGHLQRGVLADG